MMNVWRRTEPSLLSHGGSSRTRSRLCTRFCRAPASASAAPSHIHNARSGGEGQVQKSRCLSAPARRQTCTYTEITHKHTPQLRLRRASDWPTRRFLAKKSPAKIGWYDCTTLRAQSYRSGILNTDSHGLVVPDLQLDTDSTPSWHPQPAWPQRQAWPPRPSSQRPA